MADSNFPTKTTPPAATPAAASRPRFVQALNFTPSGRTAVDLIVLHSMESQERKDTAENVAAWFADPRRAPRASAHYCVDSDSTVQCVRDEDIAWAAPGANHNGIHIEMAGRARQTGAEWFDQYSLALMHRVCGLTAQLCKRWNIPAKICRPADLIVQKRGITTHAYVTAAFNRSTHTDPGPDFPLEWFVVTVASRLAENP